jgi:hypothetical protein
LRFGACMVGSAITSRFAFCNELPQQSTTNDTVGHRPTKGYTRIDYDLQNMHPEWITNNAFHGTLRGENMIEEYEVYRCDDPTDISVKCLIRFGNSLNGHPGIVHGGITAIAFDNSFGWLFLAQKLPPSFTANLNVNYRFVLS